MEVINTAVLPSVALVCRRKQEVGRMVDRCQVVALCCVGVREDELEISSFILRSDGACDVEASANEGLVALRRGLGDPVSGEGEGDVWLFKQIWRNRRT